MNTDKHEYFALIICCAICAVAVMFAGCGTTTQQTVVIEETSLERTENIFAKQVEEVRKTDPEQVEYVAAMLQGALEKMKKAYQEGRLEAKRDLKNGKLVVKTYGLPAPWRENAEHLFLKHYNIELRTVAGCEVMGDESENIQGYNEVSRQFITAKFGSNVFQKVFTEARKEYELQNRIESPKGKGLL